MKLNKIVNVLINFLLVISIVIVLYVLIKLFNKIFFEKENVNENFNDYFDCYLKLTDISPQFVNQYMKFDNQHVSNGRCKDATLHVVVETCPLDDNGIPLSSCRQTATLTSSKGNPLTFPYDITPLNVSNYFGINTEKVSATSTTTPSISNTEPITTSITTPITTSTSK
jgi:hypothetical protein